MKKTIVCCVLTAFFVCMALGYAHSLRQMRQENAPADADVQVEEVLLQKQEISDKTEIIYQYFYLRDRVMKEQREPAPVFLQGVDRKQLESIYNGWQIVYFSPERVILRCKIEGKSSESYIIGEYEGYIAVFYEDAQKTIHLHERTDIPVSTLPEGEERQLREGLRVIGEENLVKLLADYTS